MELVTVIPHPQHPASLPNELVGEQVDAYDGTQASRRDGDIHATDRIFDILLHWSSSRTSRQSWYQHADQTRVKSGMALP